MYNLVTVSPYHRSCPVQAIRASSCSTATPNFLPKRSHQPKTFRQSCWWGCHDSVHSVHQYFLSDSTVSTRVKDQQTVDEEMCCRHRRVSKVRARTMYEGTWGQTCLTAWSTAWLAYDEVDPILILWSVESIESGCCWCRTIHCSPWGKEPPKLILSKEGQTH